MITRRHFLLSGGLGLLAIPSTAAMLGEPLRKVELDAHLWSYASRFPPNWDCTPVLEEVFSDLKAAGFSGVELMESILKHEGSVERLKELCDKHSLPVSGTSFNGKMWNREAHGQILEDIDLVTERLHLVGGTMIGLTVGDAQRKKTEKELDDQAEVLKKIMKICAKHKIAPNMHNHTFELEHDLYDLKGTMARVPDLKLGPDLNWLIRGGIDPVDFIKTYGFKIVYMHLRDQDADGKWTEALGEGITDFKSIAAALKEIDYRGKAAVELAYEGKPLNPPRENWIKSREYVKQVFGW